MHPVRIPFLTTKTQRSPNVRSQVDILHSNLGLAALATMHDPDLKSIDPMLCISRSARENFEKSPGL